MTTLGEKYGPFASNKLLSQLTMMLETERLLLRPMKDEDALHLYQLNSDSEVTKYTGENISLNLADAQRMISEKSILQFQKYKTGHMAVLLKEGHIFIGRCGLVYCPKSGEVDLSYRFHKKYWGQGYATEAAYECLRYGFENLRLNKIVARSVPENRASIKVIQKLGMTFRGMLNDCIHPHGYILYDLNAQEFEKCKK